MSVAPLPLPPPIPIAPPARYAGDSVARRLPIPLTPFIGREQDVAAARALLTDTDTRLVTLTGPGGVGKTRLALQLAALLADDFRHGIVLIPLASVSDAALVGNAIAQALGIQDAGSGSVIDRLRLALNERQTLLVLDNFEQVIEAAPLIAELLSSCPHITALATTRAPLHIHGEQEYALAPLRLPGVRHVQNMAELATCEAVQLFIQRARAVTPAFALDEGNAGAIAEICTRLDGLPLAIELAAARTKVLSPAALLERLSQRLRVLIGGPRDAPARLQTMRGAIAWSYDLLDPEEQRVFRALAIFSGGFTLEAAEAVGGADGGASDPLEIVESLVDKSLLLRAQQSDDTPRFLMLETIRDFGLEQLAESGEATVVRDRHAAWYLALVQFATETMYGPALLRMLDRLDAEFDNIGAAMTWVHETGDRDSLFRFVASLWGFWIVRGHFHVARRWTLLALADRPATPTADFALVLAVAASQAGFNGDYTEACKLASEALELATTLADAPGVAFATFCLADVTDDIGRTEEARELFEQAIRLFRETELRFMLGISLGNLSTINIQLGHHDQGATDLAEALELFEQLDFAWGVALCMSNLGQIALARRDLPDATRRLQASLRSFWTLGDQLRGARGLQHIAALAVAHGEGERGARLLEAAEALLQSIGVTTLANPSRARDTILTEIRLILDETTLVAARAAGRAMTPQAAVAEALAFDPAHDAPAALTRPASTAGTPLTLSPRELDVLALVVAGRTDRQIAETLFISHRTAQGHVANIFNKLGVSSRTAAATTAMRDGLVDVTGGAG